MVELSIMKLLILKNIMPKLDGTGPRGQGPRTGRGLGFCGGGLGRGYGCCIGGRGFGFRRFFSSKNELAALEEEERILEEELIALREEKDALKNEQK